MVQQPVATIWISLILRTWVIMAGVGDNGRWAVSSTVFLNRCIAMCNSFKRNRSPLNQSSGVHEFIVDKITDHNCSRFLLGWYSVFVLVLFHSV